MIGLRSRIDRGLVLRLGLVAAVGAFALLAPQLALLRPADPATRTQNQLVVRSSADAGRGSLREAILAADRTSGSSRIHILAPRIQLLSALPPLVNPSGMVLEAEGVEIDASAVEEGVVLDVSAAGSLLRGLTVSGARGIALLVRAPRVRLERVGVIRSQVALLASEAAEDLSVEGSSFRDNQTGIVLPPRPLRSRIAASRFLRHAVAAFWQVAPRPAGNRPAEGVVLARNSFAGDRNAVVLINVAGLIENNAFVRSRDSALVLAGHGAIVRGNRVRSGASIGITATDLEGALIEGNEVDLNPAVGILLRDSRNTVLRRNQVYTNGYGIAVVFGSERGPNLVAGNLIARQLHDGLYIVGGSPVVRDNRILANGLVGIRLLDFIPASGATLPSEPLLVENVASGNGADGPVRGEYRMVLQVPPPPAEEVAR